MEFRRRRIAVAMLSLAALLGSAAVMGAPTTAPATIVPETAATDFETAKGTAAVELREKIIEGAPTGVTDRAEYASKICDAFDKHKILAGANPDGQLNAAITIAQLKTITTDGPLEAMLGNSNAAVRYWAAKGLGDIAPSIIRFKAVGKATKPLLAALTVEKSVIVQKEIFSTLVKLGDIDAVIEALKIYADRLLNAFPNMAALEAAADALQQFDKMLAGQTLSPAQKTQAAQSAAWMGSFALHQEMTKTADELPKDYHAAVLKVINAGIATLNDLAGQKDKFAPIKGEALETSLFLGGITGSTSSGKGSLQGVFSDVAVPPDIKPAATQPSK